MQSLGFRGEALHSLSVVASSVEISTKHIDSELGTCLLFKFGKLESQKKIQRNNGTTVTVSGLFYNLPVRKIEMNNNIKRDFSKLLTLLYSYAIISSSRFSCSHKTQKNIELFRTLGNSLKSNAVDLFGVESGTSLVELQNRVLIEDAEYEYICLN